MYARRRYQGARRRPPFAPRNSGYSRPKYRPKVWRKKFIPSQAQARHIRTQRARARIPMPISNIPQFQIARLRWHHADSIDPGAAGAIGIKAYGANNPRDPTIVGAAPGAGLQPVGWDFWAGLYLRYTCLGSRLKITVVEQIDTTRPIMHQVFLTTHSTLHNLTSLHTAVGISDHKSRLKISSNTEETNIHKKNFLSYGAKKFWKVSDLVAFRQNTDHGAGQTALVTADPASLVYYIVAMEAVSGAADVGSIDYIIQIDYIVMFQDFTGTVFPDAAE